MINADDKHLLNMGIIANFIYILFFKAHFNYDE